jgi:hypothetical protein
MYKVQPRAGEGLRVRATKEEYIQSFQGNHEVISKKYIDSFGGF